MFQAIDAFIIDRIFQPVADWWMSRTGKSNFWLARMFWWVYISVCGWRVIIDKDVRTLIFWLILSAVGLVMIRSFERMDTKDNFKVSTVLSPLRGSMLLMLIRLVSILMLVLPPIIRWTNLQGVLFLTLMYFSACTPKPRQPLKAGNKRAAQAFSA